MRKYNIVICSLNVFWIDGIELFPLLDFINTFIIFQSVLEFELSSKKLSMLFKRYCINFFYKHNLRQKLNYHFNF